MTQMRVMAIFDVLTIPIQQRFTATLGHAASQGCNPTEKLSQDLQIVMLHSFCMMLHL